MTEGGHAGAGSRRSGVRLTVGITLLFVAVLVSVFFYTKLQPRGMSDAELQAQGAYLFQQPRDIGGFQLTDDNGNAFGPEDLRGQWSLLFFGFTFCPDICPTTMATLAQFYDQLEPGLAEDTQVILVSVDPARDTPAKLHDYVRYFNPTFRALTGEFLELQRVATALNIPFIKERGAGENYLVEHSANVVILNDRGHYVGFFRAPLEVDKLLRTYAAIRARD